MTASAQLGPHQDQGGLPDPETGDARRKTVGVPGFRCDVAAPASGARRRARLPDHVQRRGASRCAPADGGVHRRLRTGSRRHRGLRRRRPRRVGVHQERHRGDQPGRLRAGRQPVRACCRTRRRHRHHRAGAPRQPDPLAGTGPSHRGDVAVVRGHPEGRIDMDSLAAGQHVKVVTFSHHSNVTGAVAPVARAGGAGARRSGR